jgi:hypothetical protein
MLLLKWGPIDPTPCLKNLVFTQIQSVSQISKQAVYPLLIEWGPLKSIPEEEILRKRDKICTPVAPCQENPQETVLENPCHAQNISTPGKNLYETPVVTPVPLNLNEDETTKQLRVCQLIEHRCEELETFAERNALSAHVQRLRKKRTLTESIDECLAGHVAMHEKATGLRLAFEHEASEYLNRVKSVARDLRTDLTEDVFPPPVAFQYSFEQEDWGGDCQYDAPYDDLMEVIATTSGSELEPVVETPTRDGSSSRSHMPSAAVAIDFVSTPKRMKKFMSPTKEPSALN